MPPWIGEEFHMVPYLDEEVAGINDFWESVNQFSSEKSSQVGCQIPSGHL